jgi:hypothetical protein
VEIDPTLASFAVLKERTVFDSNDPVFAWAVGKALLIVIVSIGILVYLAWAVTRQNEIAVDAGGLEDGVLRSRSSVKESKVPIAASGAVERVEEAPRILARTSEEESVEENNVHEAERPAAAA